MKSNQNTFGARGQNPTSKHFLLSKFNLFTLPRFFIRLVMAVLALFILSEDSNTLRRIIYLNTSSATHYKSNFTGCQGKLKFFRFCPSDADAASNTKSVSNSNSVVVKARSHQTSDGARLFALQDIPTIKLSDLRTVPSRKIQRWEDEIGADRVSVRTIVRSLITKTKGVLYARLQRQPSKPGILDSTKKNTPQKIVQQKSQKASKKPRNKRKAVRRSRNNSRRDAGHRGVLTGGKS